METRINENNLPEIYWYPIDDGYGIVGAGFKCFNCLRSNNFLANEEKIITCEFCKQEHFNQMPPDY